MSNAYKLQINQIFIPIILRIFTNTYGRHLCSVLTVLLILTTVVELRTRKLDPGHLDPGHPETQENPLG